MNGTIRYERCGSFARDRLSCAVAGLAVLARTFALVFTILKFAGVAYLLFLAFANRASATVMAGAAAAIATR